MHVPHPLFELRRFIFVLQYKFVKVFNSDMNGKRGLQSVSIALSRLMGRVARPSKVGRVATTSELFTCTTTLIERTKKQEFKTHLNITCYKN